MERKEKINQRYSIFPKSAIVFKMKRPGRPPFRDLRDGDRLMGRTPSCGIGLAFFEDPE